LAPLLLAEPAAPHQRVVVQASSKYAERGFGADGFASIVRALLDAGQPAVVVAGSSDEDFAHVVARKAGAPLETPASLDGWKRLIGGAPALVTLDSGAAHVAGMLGVPCVDLFAASKHVAADVRRWSPWAAPYRALVLARPPQASVPGDVAGAVAELRAGAPAS
jgi:ADP-heptose:LPS heptosyltransferase